MAGNEWMARAACRGKTEIFFPSNEGIVSKIKQAKEICARCPVFEECRATDEAYLREVGIYQVHGIVAGKHEEERREWQRRLVREGRKHKTTEAHRARHQLILDFTYLGLSSNEIGTRLGLTQRSVVRCRVGDCGLPGRTDREVAA